MKEVLKNLKCKIRVTPEESEAIQKALFAVGGKWPTRCTEVHYTNAECLYIEPPGVLAKTAIYGMYFKGNPLPEMTPKEVLDLLTEKEPVAVKIPFSVAALMNNITNGIESNNKELAGVTARREALLAENKQLNKSLKALRRSIK